MFGGQVVTRPDDHYGAAPAYLQECSHCGLLLEHCECEYTEPDPVGEVERPLRYFRSQRGAVVHLEGCRTQPPFPIWWNRADGKTPRDIYFESVRHGIFHQWCKWCFPNEPIRILSPSPVDPPPARR